MNYLSRTISRVAYGPHRRNSIRPAVAASIEQQASCFCLIIFPAIGQNTFVPIQFESFRIGVFPATTPTVMCDL
jgi:hypothetical protein